jgi:hypothetical protein
VLTKDSGPILCCGELFKENLLLGFTLLPEEQDLLKLLSWILSLRGFDLLKRPLKNPSV